ncbi:MAG: DNA polymerase I, partial [Planctomycetes bacterium]|nr:DNA polymerase I [Planctomycetota bacterium]
MSRSLYLLDGHAQIYRAYYAPYGGGLTGPSGEPTKAIHAFCSMLFNLIRTKKPDYLAMALDTSDKTVFRCEIYPEYKANREPPPEDFAPQFDRIVSIVTAMGMPILVRGGFEADDLMATVVEQLAGDDIEIFLVTKDKDLEQLVSDRVRLYDPAKDEVIDARVLSERKGYTPQQAVEIQTLAGDTVDNIPGVLGVGVKKAAKLIQQFGSAQAALDNADKLTPKLGENLRAFADQIDITRRLVTLRRDAPIEFELEQSRWTSMPVARVRPIFEELGFNRLTDQLDAFDDRDPTKPDASTDTLPGRVDSAHLPHPSRVGSAHLSQNIEMPSAHIGGHSPPYDYQLIDTKDKLDELANQLAAQKRFAFDTETTGLNPVAAKLVGISVSWQAGTGYYIPVRAAVGDALPLEHVVEKLKPIFENPAVAKCGQNLKYDIVVLRQVGIEVAGLWFDTLIASFLLRPDRRGHGIDALAADLLGHKMIPISDLIGKGKKQITLDQVDTRRVCEYACEDADFAWRLAEYFEPRIAADPVRELFETVEMPLVHVLAEMEHNGVALDTDVLQKMSVQMTRRTEELTRSIHQAAGHAFNLDSTKQLAEVLFDEQKMQVVRKTKTGRSTDAETLATLVATTDNPIPPLVLEYRELAKLKGTYVDTLPQMICPRTGRIHASFHQTGAVTGRLSSSDPNLQNIPIRTQAGRQIRRAFVAGREDHVLLTADYSQVELRILAHYSRDDGLLRAFADGQDIHAFVASQLHGIKLEEVTKEQRSAAKAVNFGIIYGQTPFGLSRSTGISMTEAKLF